MDCRNLFSTFHSIGGKLSCNYETQVCSLNKTSTCKLKPGNRFDLESLVLDYSYPKAPNTVFTHMNGFTTKKEHDLHFSLAKGFIIEKPLNTKNK